MKRLLVIVLRQFDDLIDGKVAREQTSVAIQYIGEHLNEKTIRQNISLQFIGEIIVIVSTMQALKLMSHEVST